MNKYLKKAAAVAAAILLAVSCIACGSTETASKAESTESRTEVSSETTESGAEVSSETTETSASSSEKSTSSVTDDKEEYPHEFPEGFEYQLAVIDESDDFLSFVLTTNAYGIIFTGGTSVTDGDGNSVAVLSEGFWYYTNSGNSDWEDLLAEAVGRYRTDVVPLQMSYASHNNLVMRCKTTGGVDLSNLSLTVGYVSVSLEEGGDSVMLSDVSLPFNADLSEVKICDSPSLSTAVFNEGGYYYMVDKSVVGSAGGTTEIDGTSYVYEANCSDFLCLSTSTSGLRRAKFHLIDVRTLQDMELPENIVPYLGGYYEPGGNMCDENDMSIEWGIASSVLSREEVSAAWDEISDYAVFGYETDDGLQILIY